MSEPIRCFRGTVPEALPGQFGANARWQGCVLAGHEIPAGDYGDSEFHSHLVALERSPEPYRLRWKDGTERTVLVGPGTVFVRSQQPLCHLRLDGTQRATLLTLDVRMVELALPEPFRRRPVELIAGPVGCDPFVNHIVSAMESEVLAGMPAGELLLASLGNSLALYLATRYSTDPPVLPRTKCGLGRERLSRVSEYIDAHLASALSVDDIAAIACLSSYHFARMFKTSTGLSVHQFVLNRRVERSMELLRHSDLTLAGIAAAAGFCSQSQFTTVFRRMTGVTPGAWRLAGGITPDPPRAGAAGRS